MHRDSIVMAVMKLTEELLEAVSDKRVVVSDTIHYCPQTVDTTLHNLNSTPHGPHYLTSHDVFGSPSGHVSSPT